MSSEKALDALRELVEACEAEFYCPQTEEMEPDDSKVSYPEDKCHITFGMIRRARAALSEKEQAECKWPDCGHDTNQTDDRPDCNGKFCLQPASAVPEDVLRDAELWRFANGTHKFGSSELRCHVNVGVNEWRGERWVAFTECSVDELKAAMLAAAKEGA